MRNIIAIACIACIACNANGQSKGAATTTTTVHTSAKGGVSTTVTTRGTANTFGPATASGGYQPGTLLSPPVAAPLETSGSSMLYWATSNGKVVWQGDTWTETARRRLTSKAISDRFTVVVRQGSRIVAVLEPYGN